MGNNIDFRQTEYDPNYIDENPIPDSGESSAKINRNYTLLFSPHLDYMYVPALVWEKNIFFNIQSREKKLPQDFSDIFQLECDIVKGCFWKYTQCSYLKKVKEMDEFQITFVMKDYHT